MMRLGIDTTLLEDRDFARNSGEEASLLIEDSDFRVLSIDFSRARDWRHVRCPG
jgi:hypothetical protein